MVNKLSESQCAKIALQVQDTVNAVAILNDYQDVVYSLKELYGQNHVGKHPAARIFMDKIQDLIHAPAENRMSVTDYGECFYTCKQLADAD
jgi:hypothetical protein